MVALAGAGLAVVVNIGTDLSQTDSIFGKIVYVLAVLAGGLSSFFSTLGLLPRTVKKGSIPGQETSPIFFGDISGVFDTPRGLKDALFRVGDDGESSFQDLIIHQIYENSIVASRKFRCAKIASIFLAGEVLLIVLVVVIFGFVVE
ncbi:Pycsar system effector family protein [Corynebacterium tuberculostearicum]|uniref:Pycsar system effector family protein n=1 Tax=Corynebacterium tuberculostearicum TaxID=38304 RepID=UPI0038D1316E